MHWNNPNEAIGYTDSSGVRIYYIDQPRQYEWETIFFGPLQLDIPPGQHSHLQSSYCPEQCTRAMFNETVKISSIVPHMHLLGE